jgi:hypothetical protein
MELLDYYTDGPKSTDGVWIDQGDGGRLRIARMDNPNYKKHVQQARTKLKLRRGAMSDEETKEVLKDAVAHTILLDWEGVTIDGETVPYRPDYALKVFDALPSFLDMVVNLAYTEDYFREEEISGVVEDLRPLSNGSSNGAIKQAGSKK